MRALTRYMMQLAPSSRKVIRYVLSRFLDNDGRLLPSDKIAEEYSRLMASRSPKYALLAHSSLRRLAEFSLKAKEITRDEYDAILDLPRPRGRNEKKRRLLTRQEIVSMTNVRNRRVAAVVAILAATGMRKTELAELKWEDVTEDREAGRYKFTIHGKGNVVREVSVPIDAIEKHIRFLRKSPSEWVIGHPVTGEKRCSYWVYRAVQRAARDAGIGWSVTPHDIRRAFVSHMLLLGVDVFTVARAAGHASPSMTMRYDIRPQIARDEATALLCKAVFGGNNDVLARTDLRR